MKKFGLFCAVAVVALAVTGCRWCTDVNDKDPSCALTSHLIRTTNAPGTVSLVTPNIAISREVFRPVFRAGSARLTVVGSGSDRESATYDAIAKFLDKANCDFIVSVSTVAVKNDHPKAWWDILCWCSSSDHKSTFFPPYLHIFCTYNTNYKVTLSGIPIYLEKLSTETLAADKVDAYDARSGLYLPARGYDATPVRAWRAEPPMLPVEVTPFKVDKMPIHIDGGLNKGETASGKPAVVLPSKACCPKVQCAVPVLPCAPVSCGPCQKK